MDEQIVVAVTGEERSGSDNEDSDVGEVRPTIRMNAARESANLLVRFIAKI